MANDELTTERTLPFEGVNFPPEKYFELENFFSIVQAGDGGHAVMHMAQPAASGTTNYIELQ